MPNVFNGSPYEDLTLTVFLMSTLASLGFGVCVAFIYAFRNRYSKTMALSLVVMPAIVQIVIMMVSGNIGAGVAVAGAFNLVRFRSVPGNAKDIGYIFFAMVIGFITGMGFLLYAFLFMLIMSVVFLAATQIFLAGDEETARILRIIIPENMSFDGLFDDVLEKFTIEASLDRVRMTNMGSLYELTYMIRMKNSGDTKEFLDELRCRNGNLNIFLSRKLIDSDEL